MFKQATANTFEDLYVDSKPKEDNVITPISQKVDNVKKVVTDVTDDENDLKMISVRIPKHFIKKMEHYAYMERLIKQDAYFKVFEKFLSSKEVKDILTQYDELMGGK